MTDHSNRGRDNLEHATSRQQELIAAARQAQASAYCPYSNFAVGAALLAADGKIYRGCNVENASFGLTVCAERAAVFAAVADGQMEIAAIAVVTDSAAPARPCGACRQVIAEFSKADNPVVVICVGSGDEMTVETINDLLPQVFTLL